MTGCMTFPQIHWTMDKEHFSLLMSEIREAFKKHDLSYLLTFSAAADPFQANNAYYLDEVHPP